MTATGFQISTQLAEFPNVRACQNRVAFNVGVDFTEESRRSYSMSSTQQALHPPRLLRSPSIIMLHHSCARCRQKKVRCNGESPCATCIVYGVERDCQRVTRKVRDRKPSSRSSHPYLSPESGSTSRSHNSIASPVDGSRIQHVPTASSDLCPAGPENGASIGPHPSLMPSPSLTGPSTQAATGSGVATGIVISPFSSTVHTPTSASQSRTRHFDPKSSAASIASSHSDADDLREHDVSESTFLSAKLLDRARAAIGDPLAAQHVIDEFFYHRCSSMINSCVHVPTLKAQLTQLFSEEAANLISPDELALLLMAVSFSIQVAPRGASEQSLIHICSQLGDDMSPLQRQNALHALASSMLRRIAFGTQATLARLQACIVLLVYDLDSDGFKNQIFLHALSCAETLKLDRLGSAFPVTVNNEMSVRAWWFLVCRDWFAAPQKGSYRINPRHFDTRLPILVGDRELSQLRPDTASSLVPESKQAWLPVRWTLPLIKLADLVRRLVDDKLRYHGGGRLPFAKVEESFSQLIESLPQGFRLDETYTSPWHDVGSPTMFDQRLSIERWILHQIIFATMLDFYDGHIGEPVSRQVLFLANHILDLQSRLRYRCDVIDSLRVNVDSIVRAVTLICVDLMQDTSHQGVSSIARQITLGRVREAILRCRRRAASRPADFDFVSMLLDAEAQLWTERHAPNDANCAGNPDVGQYSFVSAPLTPCSIPQADPTASSRALSVSEHTADHLAERQGRQARMQAQSPAQHVNCARDTSMETSQTTQDYSFPSDKGICPALHDSTDMIDKLWEGVIACLDRPIGS